MAFKFDWGQFLGKLGGNLQETGSSVFNLHLQNLYAEETAARDLKLYREKSQIDQERWEERTQMDQEFEEHMVTFTSETQKDYDKATDEREASLSRFYRDPEIQRELEGYISGGQAGGKFGGPSTGSIKGMLMQNLLKKVRRGEEFTDQDKQGLQMLGFATQSKLGEMDYANTQIERDYQLRKQSADSQQQMYQALTSMYTEQIQSAGRLDPNKAFATIQSATKLRQDIISSKEYMYLKGLEGGTGRKKMTKGEESQLRAMEQNLQLTEMLVQGAMGGLQPQQQPGGQGQPTPELAPEPQPEAIEQPGTVDQLGGLVGRGLGALGDIKPIQDVMGGVIGGVQKAISGFTASISSKERKAIQKISESSGIPVSEIVHIDTVIDPVGGYDQQKLQQLQKENKAVFFDGKLHRVVFTGSKWGLVPIKD